MNDQMKLLSETINHFSSYVHEMAVSKGWYNDPQRDLERLCLIHSEVSEACEGVRHGNPPDEHCPDFSSVEIELADAMIRICDFAKFKGWNIGGAVASKVEFNSTRPYMHGGKLK